MSRDDIQKLLGGYATGTLTPEEQQALFEAALTDQELFDALAREEALRDVLSDPVSRAHVLAAIDEVRAPWYRNWWRPMLVMATAAALVVVAAVYLRPPKEPELAKVDLQRLRGPAPAASEPMLPPPPELRREPSVLKQLPIPLPAVKPAPPLLAVPAAAPAPPPPAPPQSAARDGLVIGSSSAGAPMQQQAQPFQQQAGVPFQQPTTQFAPLPRNALFASDNVPVSGTVTDSSGAAIGSANVVVKSLATGETVNTATDAKGQFTAPEKPGSAYEISASAPGFKATTVNQVAPPAGASEPVNLRLDVGASAETVEVTSAATTLQATRAAGNGGGRGSSGVLGGALAEMKKAKAEPPAAVERHLFRRLPGGELSEVPPGGTVPAGSSLILQVTSASDGYLRIVEGVRTIDSPKVKRGAVHETTLPRFDKPGRVELKLYLSAQEFEMKDAAGPSFTFTLAFNVQ